MDHISLDYYNGDKFITYCGAVPKDIFQVTSSPTGRECPKCEDLYYQEFPNCNPCYNPYFCAHNSEGNSKLRKMKADKLKASKAK